MEFRLVLVGPRSDLCAAWEHAFRGLNQVEVVRGRFESIPVFDCMVSAANSFGLMDGGVDAAITRFFGDELQERVQRRILDEYRGEQPVGTTMLVETNHPQHAWLAHTPTMRIPMTIARTDNVYRAMWSMLLEVERHNRRGISPIHVVACPGLGTGTGRVPAAEAARQMSMAYRNFLDPPISIDWPFAQDRQQQVRYGGDLGHLFPPEEKIGV